MLSLQYPDRRWRPARIVQSGGEFGTDGACGTGDQDCLSAQLRSNLILLEANRNTS